MCDTHAHEGTYSQFLKQVDDMDRIQRTEKEKQLCRQIIKDWMTCLNVNCIAHWIL